LFVSHNLNYGNGLKKDKDSLEPAKNEKEEEEEKKEEEAVASQNQERSKKNNLRRWLINRRRIIFRPSSESHFNSEKEMREELHVVEDEYLQIDPETDGV
jgi:hypothetical protein